MNTDSVLQFFRGYPTWEVLLELAIIWACVYMVFRFLQGTRGAGVIKGFARFEGERLRISLYPGAFGKRFTSVVIEGPRVPWNSDLDCARSAWRAMDTEIRCSPGDWKEGEPVEDEKWWRLDHRGEQQVVWN